MKILITGNGFDIAHGLPTKYEDFINTINYIKNNSSGDFFTDYGSYFPDNNYFKANEIKNTFEFNIQYIQQIKKNINNIWLEYFIEQYTIDTWIDFEKQIEDVVVNLNKVIGVINEKYFNDNDIHESAKRTLSDISNKSKIKDILVKFKLINSSGYDSFTFNNFFFNIRNKYITGVNDEKFFNYLQHELNSFANIFDMYLNAFVKPLIEYAGAETREKFQIDKHFTFNYTNTLSDIYKYNGENQFLHGKMSDGNYLNNIVFGFNDVFEESTNNKCFIPFTKYYQKLNKRTDFNFLENLSIKGAGSLIIYFWGHSINISDKIYFDEVFDLIKNRSNRADSINIFFHSEASRSSVLLNLFTMYNKDDIINLQRMKRLIFIESTEENIQNHFFNKEAY